MEPPVGVVNGNVRRQGEVSLLLGACCRYPAITAGSIKAQGSGGVANVPLSTVADTHAPLNCYVSKTTGIAPTAGCEQFIAILPFGHPRTPTTARALQYVGKPTESPKDVSGKGGSK